MAGRSECAVQVAFDARILGTGVVSMDGVAGRLRHTLAELFDIHWSRVVFTLRGLFPLKNYPRTAPLLTECTRRHRSADSLAFPSILLRVFRLQALE